MQTCSVHTYLYVTYFSAFTNFVLLQRHGIKHIMSFCLIGSDIANHNFRLNS